MSTQASASQTAPVGELNALPQRAEKSYDFELQIFEENGYAAIRWILDPDYAIGDKDMIYIREFNKMTHEMRVVSHSTTWKTPHVWGSGLNAAYMAWNFETGKAGWRVLVATPNT